MIEHGNPETDELTRLCLEVGYTRVEYRDWRPSDERDEHDKEDMRAKRHVRAYYEKGREPNFMNGLFEIAKKCGYGTCTSGSAMDGYHRMLFTNRG